MPFQVGSTARVTVDSVEPAWNDPGILFPGDRFIRLRLPPQSVRKNWRLFDGNPSYALMSPAPSPSPAYTNRIVSPSGRFSGFVVFTGIPRDVTTLQLEAKFGTQSVTFKLPSVKQDCSP